MKSIGTVDSPSNPMESAAAGVIGRGQVAPVNLDRRRWIGRGWKRECYLHPIDPGLCIKVASDIPVGTPGWRERVVSLCRKGSVGDAHNRREWKVYCAFGTILAPFVPRYHGFVPTTLGLGLAIELLRDGNGAPSSPLRGWLHQASADRGAALLDQFRVLFDLLATHDLWLWDFSHENFVVQVAADGTERPWLIDLKRLFDNKEMFQRAYWSHGLKRRELARRINRFNAEFMANLGG